MDVVVTYSRISKSYLAADIEVVCIECPVAVPAAFKRMVVEVYCYYLVAVCYVAAIASATVSAALPVVSTQMSTQVIYAGAEVDYLIIEVVYLAIDVGYVTLYAVNVWHLHFKLSVSQ